MIKDGSDISGNRYSSGRISRSRVFYLHGQHFDLEKSIMAEGEKFSIKKLVASPFTGLYWVKTSMYGLGLAALFFIGFGLWKAYFKKPEPTQSIHAEAGSNVKVIQYNERKKTLIPFVEVYVDQRAGQDNLGGGIRAGVRFEW